MPRRSALERQVRTHQRRVARLERKAAQNMLGAYAHAWHGIRAEMDRILADLQAARDAGQEVPANWARRTGRLEALEARVSGELDRFAAAAHPRITRAQRDAVRMARENAKQKVDAQLPKGVAIDDVWVALPTAAVEASVAAQERGPVRGLLDKLGPEASRRVGQTLTSGVARGLNPRRIARQIQGDVGGGLDRALTISRTETLRSYRLASRALFQANPAVTGWTWYCAMDDTSCAFCIAEHGESHPQEETLDSHPNCMCEMIPELMPINDILAPLGLQQAPGAGVPFSIEKGPAQFAKWAPERQRSVLGPAKFAAYKAGAVTLKDLQGERWSPQWGVTRFEQSLKAAIGPERAAEFKS